jgi:hypothetical protein
MTETKWLDLDNRDFVTQSQIAQSQIAQTAQSQIDRRFKQPIQTLIVDFSTDFFPADFIWRDSVGFDCFIHYFWV